MATPNELAQRYIQRANGAPPQARYQIYREAAQTFMGLSQQQSNQRTAQRLAELGLVFANEASSPRPATIDDFTDLLQETAQAYDEVGDDPMDLVARRRQIHDERTPATPGNVSIAPESFNKDATLGRSTTVKFNPTDEDKRNGIVQSQTLAFWQGTKREAQAVTVDCSVQHLQSPVTGVDLRPYGEVQYGSDGHKTTVRFDLGLGKRFTVVGNYVSVNLGMGVPAAGATDYPLFVGASIGTFAAPSQGPLISTVYYDAFTGGYTDGLPIPNKAVTLLPVLSNIAATSVFFVQFLNAGGNVISTMYYESDYTAYQGPFAVPGDAAFVRLNNTGAASDFRLPFQLAL